MNRNHEKQLIMQGKIREIEEETEYLKLKLYQLEEKWLQN